MNLFASLRPIAGLLVLAGMVWIGAAPARAEVGLPALVPIMQVNSDGIFLDQILIAPASESLPHLRLADAPPFGQAVSFPRSQVLQWLRAQAPQFGLTNLGGAAQIKISRLTRHLDEAALRQMLAAALQREVVKDKGELELRLARPWTPAVVPDDELELKLVDVPAGGLSSSFSVRFDLMCGRERVGTWQFVAQAKVWREVLVAASPSRRGRPLPEVDLVRERRDVLTIRDALPVTAQADASLELVENLQTGQPVLDRSVRVRPVVQRGQVVVAQIQDGSLLISLKVEVLEDGLPGQVIRVRNPKTRREFTGKVQDETTIVAIL